MEALIPLATGAAGGLLGGNVTGALFRKSGMGAGSSSLVGIIGGALATQFLGPTLGPMVGMAIGSGSLDLMSIIGNLAAGAGGGGVLGIVIGIVRSLFSR